MDCCYLTTGVLGVWSAPGHWRGCTAQHSTAQCAPSADIAELVYASLLYSTEASDFPDPAPLQFKFYYLCEALADNDLSLFVLRTNKASEQNEFQVGINPSPEKSLSCQMGHILP